MNNVISMKDWKQKNKGVHVPGGRRCQSYIDLDGNAQVVYEGMYIPLSVWHKMPAWLQAMSKNKPDGY